jgi:N-acetylmuramoyl-L-alanine amidase
MYTEKTAFAARGNYGGVRAADAIKFLIYHYTANDGDSDEGNGNYFQQHIIQASAHDFVDDDSVTHSVPYLYTAWSVGGPLWDDCGQHRRRFHVWPHYQQQQYQH